MICVDYEEFKPETYAGVYVFDNGNQLYKSNTGNPIKDMDNVLKKLRKHHPGECIPFSSSATDFLSDGDKYTFKYNKNNEVVGYKLQKNN